MDDSIHENNHVISSNSDGEPSEIDILISNVVCTFDVRCHLNLRTIALKGVNVEYRRQNSVVLMKLRNPRINASIWSSGKITLTGASSEHDAKMSARKVARILQKMEFKIQFRNFRIVNVLGACVMPFKIRVNAFSQKYKNAVYEPELHPGLTYKISHLKATLKVFYTGSITITAPSVSKIQAAIEYIFPIVKEFRRDDSPGEPEADNKNGIISVGGAVKRPWSATDDNKDVLSPVPAVRPCLR